MFGALKKWHVKIYVAPQIIKNISSKLVIIVAGFHPVFCCVFTSMTSMTNTGKRELYGRRTTVNIAEMALHRPPLFTDQGPIPGRFSAQDAALHENHSSNKTRLPTTLHPMPDALDLFSNASCPAQSASRP